jgi:hypothetical protein
MFNVCAAFIRLIYSLAIYFSLILSFTWKVGSFIFPRVSKLFLDLQLDKQEFGEMMRKCSTD